MTGPSALVRKIGAAAEAIAYAALAAALLTEVRALVRALPRTPPEDPVRRSAPTVSRLAVLVPGLNEQAYAGRTVAAFGVALEACPQADVWFVTTEREAVQASAPTTAELIQQQLRDGTGRRPGHLHYPYRTGNKSSQLNWAVQVLREQGRLADEDYVGVFDFDAQPPPSLFPAVLERAGPDTDVIQAVPIGVGTLHGPPASAWQRALVSVEAWHHATRSLGIERARLHRSRPGRPACQYFMGTGLFIRTAALQRLGGFPLVEDIPLGYAASLRRYGVATVGPLVPVDLPGRLSAQLRSLKFITHGVNSWIDVMRDGRADPQVRNRDLMRLVIVGMSESFELSGYPWLGALLTARAVSKRGGPARRMLAGLFWLFPLLQTLLMRRRIAGYMTRDEWATPPALVIAASLGRRFWRSVGGVRLQADWVARPVTRRPTEFTRGDRAAS